jgi:hypothetical protein
MGRARRARRATGHGRFPRPVGRGRRRGFTDRRETRVARDDATARGARHGAGRRERIARGSGREGARTWQYVTTNASSEAPAGFPVAAATDEARRAGARIGARRRASAHRAERSVSASEDAVAAAIGVRARGGRVRSRAGNPEWFSSARCTATRPDLRKGRERRRSPDEPPKAANARKKAVCFSSVGTPPRFGHQTVARKETPGASAFPRGKNPPIASSWQIRLPPSWRTRRRGPRAARGAHIRPRRARDSASAADTAPPPRTPRRAFATARRPRVTHGTLALAAPTPRFPSSDAPRIAHPRRIRAEK